MDKIAVDLVVSSGRHSMMEENLGVAGRLVWGARSARPTVSEGRRAR